MARLTATRHNLYKAFRKHKACYEALKPGHDQCRRLILFYAVEMGLKVYLLDKIRKHSTDDLFSHHEYIHLKNNSHDIREMLKLAKMQGQFTLKALKGKNNVSIAPSQYHQLWRYGLESIDAEDEKEAEMVLCDIISCLDQNVSSKQLKRS